MEFIRLILPTPVTMAEIPLQERSGAPIEILFHEQDGVKIYMDVYIPSAATQETPAPILLWWHGEFFVPCRQFDSLSFLVQIGGGLLQVRVIIYLL